MKRRKHPELVILALPGARKLARPADIDGDPGGWPNCSLQGGGVSGSVIDWQAGEQGGQFFAGAGAQGLPGSLVELVRTLLGWLRLLPL